MTTTTASSKRAVALLHLVWALALLLTVTPAVHGNMYRGTISGQVGKLFDISAPHAVSLTLPNFGFDAPIFDDELVSGFYSYESSSRDVDSNIPFSDVRNINITFSLGDISNSYSWDVTFFKIVDGTPDFSGDFTDPRYNVTAHGMVGETLFDFTEAIWSGMGPPSYYREISGELVCGQAIQVPELSSTLFLSGIAFAILAACRRSCRRTEIR